MHALFIDFSHYSKKTSIHANEYKLKNVRINFQGLFPTFIKTVGRKMFLSMTYLTQVNKFVNASKFRPLYCGLTEFDYRKSSIEIDKLTRVSSFLNEESFEWNLSL